MRKLIDIITEASTADSQSALSSLAQEGPDDGIDFNPPRSKEITKSVDLGEPDRVEEALKSLGISYAETSTHDPVLKRMVGSATSTYEVQFSKNKSRARDVLTEIARESGLDLQNAASTQAKDGSIWTHAWLKEGSTVVAAAAARDASRHRDHPDFGSYLHIAVAAITEEAKPTKYSKKTYTDTEQRDCVKVTSPDGKVVYDGPKTLFKGIEGKVEVDEEITGYKQLKGYGTEPVGNLPDSSTDDVKAERVAAAKRVAAKRAARAKMNESSEQDEVLWRIRKIINDGLDNYSGIDHGEDVNAAFEIEMMEAPTKEQIHKVIDSIGSFDPYEGFELDSIENVTNDICHLLGISV